MTDVIMSITEMTDKLIAGGWVLAGGFDQNHSKLPPAPSDRVIISASITAPDACEVEFISNAGPYKLLINRITRIHYMTHRDRMRVYGLRVIQLSGPEDSTASKAMETVVMNFANPGLSNKLKSERNKAKRDWHKQNSSERIQIMTDDATLLTKALSNISAVSPVLSELPDRVFEATRGDGSTLRLIARPDPADPQKSVFVLTP